LYGARPWIAQAPGARNADAATNNVRRQLSALSRQSAGVGADENFTATVVVKRTLRRNVGEYGGTLSGNETSI
jgi:hypothetical protein